MAYADLVTRYNDLVTRFNAFNPANPNTAQLTTDAQDGAQLEIDINSELSTRLANISDVTLRETLDLIIKRIDAAVMARALDALTNKGVSKFR